MNSSNANLLVAAAKAVGTDSSTETSNLAHALLRLVGAAKAQGNSLNIASAPTGTNADNSNSQAAAAAAATNELRKLLQAQSSSASVASSGTESQGVKPAARRASTISNFQKLQLASEQHRIQIQLKERKVNNDKKKQPAAQTTAAPLYDPSKDLTMLQNSLQAVQQAPGGQIANEMIHLQTLQQNLKKPAVTPAPFGNKNGSATALQVLQALASSSATSTNTGQNGAATLLQAARSQNKLTESSASTTTSVDPHSSNPTGGITVASLQALLLAQPQPPKVNGQVSIESLLAQAQQQQQAAVSNTADGSNDQLAILRVQENIKKALHDQQQQQQQKPPAKSQEDQDKRQRELQGAENKQQKARKQTEQQPQESAIAIGSSSKPPISQDALAQIQLLLQQQQQQPKRAPSFAPVAAALPPQLSPQASTANQNSVELLQLLAKAGLKPPQPQPQPVNILQQLVQAQAQKQQPAAPSLNLSNLVAPNIPNGLNLGNNMDIGALAQLLQLQQQGQPAVRQPSPPQQQPPQIDAQTLALLISLQQKQQQQQQQQQAPQPEVANGGLARLSQELQQAANPAAGLVALQQRQPSPAATAAAPAQGVSANEKKRRRGRTGTFPQKMHQMLDDMEKNGTMDVASFLPHGNAFAIHRPKDFAEKVMPNYFKMGSFASFQRQLNLYNFIRVADGPDRGAYRHDKFIRGKPLLSTTMRRTKIKGGTNPAAFVNNEDMEF